MDVDAAIEQIAQVARKVQDSCDADTCCRCPAYLTLDYTSDDLCLFSEILGLIHTAKFQAEQAVSQSNIHENKD